MLCELLYLITILLFLGLFFLFFACLAIRYAEYLLAKEDFECTDRSNYPNDTY